MGRGREREVLFFIWIFEVINIGLRFEVGYGCWGGIVLNFWIVKIRVYSFWTLKVIKSFEKIEYSFLNIRGNYI